eukprot:Hpha_TRINITY_DN22500_c0_g1::TRINITY_DN22500_c0_g1_i1::g.185121::m.185121
MSGTGSGGLTPPVVPPPELPPPPRVSHRRISPQRRSSSDVTEPASAGGLLSPEACGSPPPPPRSSAPRTRGQRRPGQWQWAALESLAMESEDRLRRKGWVALKRRAEPAEMAALRAEAECSAAAAEAEHRAADEAKRKLSRVRAERDSARLDISSLVSSVSSAADHLRRLVGDTPPLRPHGGDVSAIATEELHNAIG